MTVPRGESGIEPLDAGDPPRIGGYRLLGRLGAGGMGRVYLGISPGERLAAVKLVHSEYAADPEFRARFRLETLAARAVSGAFTAPVLEADPSASQPWLAVLYVPALTLQEASALLGPMPVETVRALAAALAEALRSIHSAGLVHRDLKPGNVLLTASGPLVIDFGISRALDGTRVTHPGSVIGTVGYMAPEQLRSDSALDPAGDVFALGCVLAFAASCELPFGTGRPDEIARRVVREPPQLGRVPTSLHPLIAPCLEKDPAARPSTDALLAQLMRTDFSVLTPPLLLEAISVRARAASELAAQATDTRRDSTPDSVESASIPTDEAPTEPPWRRMSRRRFLALAGGGVAAVGGGLALAGVFGGSNGLPGPRASWTATVPSPTAMLQAMQKLQSVYFTQDSIALVGSTLIAMNALSAAAYAPATGAILWSWEYLATTGGGPEIPGAAMTIPCGLTPSGIYGWGESATGLRDATFFSADASGAVTGQWAVADMMASDPENTLYFCARSGDMAVFVQRAVDVMNGGIGINVVTAFDVRASASSWNFELQNAGTGLTYYTTSVASDSHRVYVQDGSDTYALDPVAGTTLWHAPFSATSAVPTQLMLTNGKLLVGSTHVTAINPANGRVLWKSAGEDSAAQSISAQAAAAKGPYSSLLSVVGSTAYLCDGASSVYAFDIASGATQWTYSNQNLRLITAGGYQPSTGFASSKLVAVPVGSGGSNTAPAESFVALDPGTGKQIGSYTFAASPGGNTPWQLIVADATVYAAAGDFICAFEGGS